MEESILGTFPMDVSGPRYGLVDFCDVYFTNRRLIANVVDRGIWPRSFGKLRFFGSFFILIPMIGFWTVMEYIVLRSMTRRHTRGPFADVEQIVKADKRNVALAYGDTGEIELKEKSGLWGPPQVRVKLAQGKQYRLQFKKQYFNDVRGLLQSAAGTKLKDALK